MKLGVSYNLFDGEELLKSSILSIRDNVDFISVVFQTESNCGNSGNPEVTKLLNDLEKERLIDLVVHYTPDLGKSPSDNEIIKRNIGLDLSREYKCTHHLSMDADEFYDKEDFEVAKIEIEAGNYNSSACRLLTYYKNNRTVLDPMEDYYVSFIYKIHKEVNYSRIPFPVLVDPTRRMPAGKLKVYDTFDLVMHHFSYVRNNLKLKLENSSAKENWDEQMAGKVIHYFNQWQPGMDALTGPHTFYPTKQIEPKFKI